MRRIIVTASDLHDGQYTKSSRILSKCWPLGELKLSPAQNVFGRVCGYRDYHDVHQNAVQTVDASASLTSSSAAEIVAWNMYRNFNIPFAEARVVAGKLHLGKFAVCQASPLEQAISARAGKPLVMDEFHLLTPGNKWSSWTPALIAAGVSPFSYSVDRSGAVVQWRLVTDQAWADVLCASLVGIQTITNAQQPADYKALYVLRIGLADDEACLEECKFFSDVVRNLPAVCHEYSLGNNIQPGEFGKLTLTLNGTDFI